MSPSRPRSPFLATSLLLGLLMAGLLPATASSQTAQGSRIEYPAGEQPLIVTIPGPLRWVLAPGDRFTPVGPDSGRLTVFPAYDELEDGAPNCVEMIDRPADGVAVVRAHPALPTGPGWHPAANTAGDMFVACLMLKDLRVLFEVRGFRAVDSPRLKPLLSAFADAARTRYGAAGGLR